MGSIRPHCKEIPQHFMCEFLIILHIVSFSVGLTFTLGIGCNNHLLCSSHTKLLHSLQMNLVFLSFHLGQMSLNTCKDARTLHDSPRRLAIMLRSARHRTSQKKKNYLYYMEGTMGSVCPQAEINVNKK